MDSYLRQLFLRSIDYDFKLAEELPRLREKYNWDHKQAVVCSGETSWPSAMAYWKRWPIFIKRLSPTYGESS